MENDRKQVLCTEKNSSALMKDLVLTRSTPGDLVSDMFAGPLFTAKVFLLLNKPKVLAGCERYPGFVDKLQSWSVEDFACRLLIDESNLERGQQLMEAARVLSSYLKSQRL